MVNKIINYLLNIYILKFKFGEKDKLKIVTDTSFTDNKITKKAYKDIPYTSLRD